MDRLWEELLFACIGGIYDEPTIRGVVLSLRAKGDVISVWNSDNRNYIRIGEKLQEIANLHPSTQMEYKKFQNALRDNSSKSHAQAYAFVPQQMTPIIAPIVPVVPVEPIPSLPSAAGAGMAGEDQKKKKKKTKNNKKEKDGDSISPKEKEATQKQDETLPESKGKPEEEKEAAVTKVE